MSNQTTLMCDVLPVWTGYAWGAQGGATFDICSLFLVTVPPFLALYFAVLYFMTTLESENNIVERFDKKVETFNQRVKRILLALKAQDLPGQLVETLGDLGDLPPVQALAEIPSFLAAYSAYTASKYVVRRQEEEVDLGDTTDEETPTYYSWASQGAETRATTF